MYQWQCNLGHRPLNFPKPLNIHTAIAINNGYKENSFRVHARNVVSHKQIIS